MSDLKNKNIDWFYGSGFKFKDWDLKPSTHIHVASPAVIFTSERNMAARFGGNISVSHLHDEAKVFDWLDDQGRLEQIRLRLMSHPIFSRSIYIDKNQWRNAWVTGEVLKFKYEDDSLEQLFYRTISSEAEENDLHPSDMKDIFFKNLNNSYLYEICSEVKLMGYDAICLYDGSEDSKTNAKVLVLFNRHLMTLPKWNVR